MNHITNWTINVFVFDKTALFLVYKNIRRYVFLLSIVGLLQFVQWVRATSYKHIMHVVVFKREKGIVVVLRYSIYHFPCELSTDLGDWQTVPDINKRLAFGDKCQLIVGSTASIVCFSTWNQHVLFINGISHKWRDIARKFSVYLINDSVR